jgi:SAM-dependent methyltransferase
MSNMAVLGIARQLYSKSRETADFLKLYSRGKVHKGYCPICQTEVVFLEKGSWLRDFYFCSKCNSIPRQRAIVVALNLFFPDWKKLKIHESSPGGISSSYLKANCGDYEASQFFQDVRLGQYKDKVRCENLEKMTFADRSFDLVITQDVFEHVMHPDAAFQEISRVLKPGGAHVFTMPWYSKRDKTIQRAEMKDGEIEFLEKPVYHGNPIDNKGSLVTFDWGIDFPDFIYKNSGMFTTVYLAKDRTMGLQAEFLEVFISRKPQVRE